MMSVACCPTISLSICHICFHPCVNKIAAPIAFRRYNDFTVNQMPVSTCNHTCSSLYHHLFQVALRIGWINTSDFVTCKSCLQRFKYVLLSLVYFDVGDSVVWNVWLCNILHTRNVVALCYLGWINGAFITYWAISLELFLSLHISGALGPPCVL